MRRALLRSLVPVLVAGACSAPAAAASSDPPRIDGLWASTSGGTLRVSGSASFSDEPGVVADQPGTGTLIDVTTATIERPVGGDILELGYNLDAPTTDLPSAVYLWPIRVGDLDFGYYLMAGRIGVGSTEPTFVLAAPGDSQWEIRAVLEGSLTHDRVEWRVPMSLIGATRGSVIAQGGGSWAEVRSGVAGLAYCCTVYDRFDLVTLDPYVVPGAEVRLGLASAGTPHEDVPLHWAASVDPSTGAFAATIPSPEEGSDLRLVARACWTGTDCVYRSVPIA